MEIKKKFMEKKVRIIIFIFIILCIFLCFGINYLYQSGGLISNKTHRLLDQGQAYDLGDGITAVVVLQESPLKVLISTNGEKTWKTHTVQGSERIPSNEKENDNVRYEDSFIGFHKDGSGYLVLTTGMTLGSQDARIFLTSDLGSSWTEAGNLNQIHRFGVTGAGLSSEGILFMSYRYYEDQGPDIWFSENRGVDWKQLKVSLPEKYSSANYRFNALSPTFRGKDGVYPVELHDLDAENHEIQTVYLKSSDGGKTWSFDESAL